MSLSFKPDSMSSVSVTVCPAFFKLPTISPGIFNSAGDISVNFMLS